jgi:hypothetical protein
MAVTWPNTGWVFRVFLKMLLANDRLARTLAFMHGVR